MAAGVLAGGPTSGAAPESRGQIEPAVFGARLSFEPNRGQAYSGIDFLARGPGYAIYLDASETVLALRSPAPSGESAPRVTFLRLRLIGGNGSAESAGVEPLPGTVNHLRGSDPAGWRTGLPTFAKVRYAEVYPKVDLLFYGDASGQLEHDFVVAPGGDPASIELVIDGVEKLAVDEHGDVVVSTPLGEARLRRAFLYQERDGVRQPVEGGYVQRPADAQRPHRIAFAVGEYDRRRPLVIDPVLEYSTFYGGHQTETGKGIGLDDAGRVYFAGETLSTELGVPPFPLQDPFDGTQNGGFDAFVAKLSPDGQTIHYSTFIGGSSEEVVRSLAVDGMGNVVVTGLTASIDYPTFNAAQGSNAGGEDAFVTMLDPTGSALVYSTYLGGSSDDQARDVALDAQSAAYVAGSTESANFPVTPGAVQQNFGGGTDDGFVAKYTATGTVSYVSFLGGSGFDASNDAGIAVDASGAAYVTGDTTSADFPTTPFVKEPLLPGNQGFVTKLSADGSSLVYSSFHDDAGRDIAVDAAGQAHVSGSKLAKVAADASADLFSVSLGQAAVQNGVVLDGDGNAYVTGQIVGSGLLDKNAFQDANAGSDDAFVAKLDASGTTEWASYLGGFFQDRGFAIAIDACANPWVTGQAQSGFPTQDPIFPFQGGTNDAFVAKIGPAARAYIGHVVDTSMPVFDSGGFEQLDTIALGSSVLGVAVAPDGSEVYATDSSFNGSLLIVDVATKNVTTVGVGGFPAGVAASPDGKRVYVANSGFDGVLSAYTVSVVHLDQANLVETIALNPGTTGNVPRGVAVHPDSSRVYVSNQQAGGGNPGHYVAIIDVDTSVSPATHTVDGTGVPEPFVRSGKHSPQGLEVNPAGTRLYVANNESGTITAADLTQNPPTVATIAVGGQPFDVAVHPDGTKVYASDGSFNDSNLWGLDVTTFPGTLARTRTIASGAVGARGVAVTPNGKSVFVAAVNLDEVRVFSTSFDPVPGLAPAGTLMVGDQPVSLGSFIGGPLLDPACASPGLLFADGFESGDISSWTMSVP